MGACCRRGFPPPNAPDAPVTAVVGCGCDTGRLGTRPVGERKRAESQAPYIWRGSCREGREGRAGAIQISIPFPFPDLIALARFPRRSPRPQTRRRRRSSRRPDALKGTPLSEDRTGGATRAGKAQ
ncbi:hypothetical protein OH77DRAFT_1128222 [Trametes cingulata]|nr:hypothetical protein OH77DRAFT_1128222 [Trametes cingulata]